MKIIKSFLNIIIVILFVILIFLVILKIVGFSPYIISSSSMSPEFEVNTIVFSKKVNFNSLKNGDIIVFVNSNGNKVCHRIMEIDEENEQIITKGDNNEFIDILPVDKDNIQGKVCFKIPYSDKIISKVKGIKK